MGLYRPLAVTALIEGSVIPETDAPVMMRMNLVQSSSEDPRTMYFANGDKIHVHQFLTLTPTSAPRLVTKLSDPRGGHEETADRTINVIKVGYLGTEEVLVSADENADVCVWFTANLQRDPLLLSVTESAWGIDIHAEQRMIAVSSNAHTVTVFHCGIQPRQPQTFPSNASSSSFAFSNSPPTTTAPPAPIEHTSQQILRGHGHNIPCATFSQCGHFLASASVDQTCRVWRLSDGKEVFRNSLGQLWGWGVAFVAQDAWMTICPEEFKSLSKHHLRLGQIPGQNVRDNPMSREPPFVPRRNRLGRDTRMIQSRWYAGSMHYTSFYEEEESSESDGAGSTHHMYGDMEEEDDSEDGWEDMMDEDSEDEVSAEAEGESPETGREEDLSSHQEGQILMDSAEEEEADDRQDAEVEETEDAVVAEPRQTGNNKRKSMDQGRRSLDLTNERHSGTSENETERAERERSTVENEPFNHEPDRFVRIMDSSESSQGQPLPTKVPVSNIARPQPSRSSLALSQKNTGPKPNPAELLLCATSRNIYVFSQRIEDERSARSGQPPSSRKSEIEEEIRNLPSFLYAQELVPEEWAETAAILAANIPGTVLTVGQERDRRDLKLYRLVTGQLWEMYKSQVRREHGDVDVSDEEDDDIDDNDEGREEGEVDQDGGDGWAAFPGQQSETGRHGDESRDYYDGTDEVMEMEQDEDDDQDDEFYTGEEEEEGEDEEEEGEAYNHIAQFNAEIADPTGPASLRYTNKTTLSPLPSMYTISVAREAAARADGRWTRQLDHFDRLFVMTVVPEFGVLVAASQKGTVAVFRLLKVVESSPVIVTPHQHPPPANSAAAAGSAHGANQRPAPAKAAKKLSPEEKAKKEERKVELMKVILENCKRDSLRLIHDMMEYWAKEGASAAVKVEVEETMVLNGERYVLFPEVYLPRKDPPPLPLLGVSVVSLAPRTVNAAGAANVPPEGNTHPPTDAAGSASASASASPSALPAASTSFLVHLVYVNGHLFTYEMRLKNEKDDPVGLYNVFV